MTKNDSIYAYIVILIGALVISTFFISMHADAAEAIQIIYLLDQEFLHRNEN
jgi:NADH:ubiquinone oxidoreductase subunit 6 (subunit J)